jgi:hypothetical protein
MRDLGIEKLANPLIGVNYRASLGSANSFNDCSPIACAVQQMGAHRAAAHAITLQTPSKPKATIFKA